MIPEDAREIKKTMTEAKRIRDEEFDALYKAAIEAYNRDHPDGEDDYDEVRRRLHNRNL